jgi:type IV pilus assembly protein PilP
MIFTTPKTLIPAVCLLLGIVLGTVWVVRGEAEKPETAAEMNEKESGQKPMDTVSTDSPKGADAEVKETRRYVYNPGGKRDPFRSLILERTASAVPVQSVAAGPICDDHVRSPLESWDLPLLRLTGVLVRDEKDWFGMIGAPDGRGYSVRENHYVGRNCGRVTEILPDRIVITEQWRRTRGNIDTLIHTLKLRPEEE